MKVTRLIGIALKLIIFILLLVLAINNMQPVEFNFYGIYTLKLPLIVTLAIFSLGGFALGLMLCWFNSLSLKTQLNKLKKELAATANSSTNPTR